MKEYPMEWLSLSGLPKYPSKVKGDYGISSIPAFMIVDKDGKIIASQYVFKDNAAWLMGLDDVKNIVNERLK